MALILAVPMSAGQAPAAADGAAAAAIQGELEFYSVTSTGPTTVFSDTLRGLFLLEGDDPFSGDWNLQAASLGVSWIHEWGYGVALPAASGSLAYEPAADSENGSKEYTRPKVTSGEIQADFQMIVVPVALGNAVHAEATFEAGIDMSPAAGNSWLAGPPPADSLVFDTVPMAASHEPVKGNPVVTSRSAGIITVQGDFVLHVWGASVSVSGDQASDGYQSGRWREEIAAPAPDDVQAPVYEQHQQLLTLRVTDGLLSVRLDAGRALIEASDLSTTTDGLMEFEAETVEARTRNHYYVDRQTGFEMTGALGLDVVASATALELLAGQISGMLIDTDLEESAIPPEDLPPSDGEDVSLIGGESNVESQNALAQPEGPRRTASIGLLILVVLLAGIALISAGGWIVTRRLLRGPTGAAPSSTDELLVHAETAFVRGDGANARTILKPVLAAEPNNSDAWFVHGASLIRDGEIDQAIKDLTPVAKKLKTDAGVAFLLCMAFLRKNDAKKAAPWALVAAKEPEYLEQMQFDPSFAQLLRVAPPTKAIARSVASDVAYS